jgi:DNA-binding XRE family transcriptional regulator
MKRERIGEPGKRKGVRVFEMTLTPQQCRAARAWLGLTQGKLARNAGVAPLTVRDFEAGRRVPIASSVTAIRAALEKEGIGFTFAIDGDESYACGITFSKRSIDEVAVDGLALK